MATYKKQLKDQNGDNIIPALGTATVTSTNIDWTTLASTEWVTCPYNTGFKASTNTGYSAFGVQACIYAGFLYIRFSASRTSGDFAANTEYTISTIPATVGGVDVSNLTSGTKGNLMRFSISGTDSNCGWCQLYNRNLVVALKTGSSAWITGQMMLPLNA